MLQIFKTDLAKLELAIKKDSSFYIIYFQKQEVLERRFLILNLSLFKILVELIRFKI